MPEPVPVEPPPALFVALLRETQGPLYGFVRGLVGDDEQVRNVTLPRPPTTTHGAGATARGGVVLVKLLTE